MSLIPMNVEQMRRKALENSQAKLKQQKDFKNQVDNMSTRSLNIVEVFFQKIVSQILPPRAVNINLSLKFSFE